MNEVVELKPTIDTLRPPSKIGWVGIDSDAFRGFQLRIKEEYPGSMKLVALLGMGGMSTEYVNLLRIVLDAACFETEVSITQIGVVTTSTGDFGIPFTSTQPHPSFGSLKTLIEKANTLLLDLGCPTIPVPDIRNKILNAGN